MGQIVPGAATSVLTANVAGPVGLGVTTANVNGTSVASVSYGPYPMNCDVLITATYTATVTPTATVGFQVAGRVIDGNGGTSPEYPCPLVPGGSGATDAGMHISARFAYAAGTGPFTAELRGRGQWPAGSLPAPSASFKDVHLRVEVIKR